MDKRRLSPLSNPAKLLRGASAILEIGCGKANVLKYHPEIGKSYCGVNFSEKLIALNRKQFPKATFGRIERPDQIPFRDESFDTVFNVFVLEHVVRPQYSSKRNVENPKTGRANSDHLRGLYGSWVDGFPSTGI